MGSDHVTNGGEKGVAEKKTCINMYKHPGGPKSEVVKYVFFFKKSSFRLGENTIQRSQKL